MSKYCENCEQQVQPTSDYSTTVLLILLVLGIFPGILYGISVVIFGDKKCPQCNDTNWRQPSLSEETEQPSSDNPSDNLSVQQGNSSKSNWWYIPSITIASFPLVIFGAALKMKALIFIYFGLYLIGCVGIYLDAKTIFYEEWNPSAKLYTVIAWFGGVLFLLPIGHSIYLWKRHQNLSEP